MIDYKYNMSEVYTSSGKKYQGEKAIISLTSWKARINTVSKTLYSLINQNLNFHIVLVLSQDEFPKKELELPENLLFFIKHNIIELLWCIENLKPHKKYFYTMQKYKTVPIITVDDDGIYDNDLNNRLYNAWRAHPNCVCANRCHLITFDSNGKILPYNKWKHVYDLELTSHLLFPTGVGGVIYPPNCFTLTEENKNELYNAFFNDDFYLKVLEIRNNIQVYNIKTNFRHPKVSNDNDSLCSINVFQNRNDTYIQNFINDFNKLK